MDSMTVWGSDVPRAGLSKPTAMLAWGPPENTREPPGVVDSEGVGGMGPHRKGVQWRGGGWTPLLVPKLTESRTLAGTSNWWAYRHGQPYTVLVGRNQKIAQSWWRLEGEKKKWPDAPQVKRAVKNGRGTCSPLGGGWRPLRAAKEDRESCHDRIDICSGSIEAPDG